MDTYKRSFYIHIDSSTDTLGSTPGSDYNVDFSNCEIKFNKQLRLHKVCPRVFTCVNSWYPIAQNNVLGFEDSDENTYAVSIANADYSGNASGLATAIQTAMNASGSTTTFTVTYSSTTGKFTIGGDNAFTLQLSSNAPLSAILGFDPVDKTGSTSYTSDNIPNITGPNYIMLVSNALGQEQTVFRNKNIPVIAKIPVTVGFGSTLIYNIDDVELRYGKSGKIVHNADFQLMYPDGTLVDLNGIPWSITMEVENIVD